MAAAAATLMLVSCGAGGEPVPYTDVSARLRPAEFPRQNRQVFRSRPALADYLGGAMPGRKLVIPEIDFTRREAILVAAGPRSSTGYELRILGVREQGGKLLVTIRERTPSLGDPVEPRVTYPYRLITVPRSSKSLKLQWLGRP